MSRPSTKGLSRFMIPTGLYRLRASQLERKLLTLHRRYKAKRITKAQARTLGEEAITEHGDVLYVDCLRWFRKNKLAPKQPETREEADQFTKEKIEEWNRIVSDM